MENQESINVEVAYAIPEKQQIVPVKVASGCSVYDAVEQSNITQQFPELVLAEAKFGVFGKVIAKPKQHILEEGDRVEIYRPLIADPKEVRKQRAAKVKAAKAQQKAGG